ncbi:hypothetical protein GQ602_000507 [Ophiocordyceps camponoti-floridani]|uniref:AA1-like domain-containing protein n=1 Tax=Ophiocordyceps camponoti-floridani TaxID=2030778 RepID=A0A8H4QCB1_9HYPO|nr:hypothetical protein GQ602_000507 [Ophiocordyceps camponoti-floridani]
MHALALALTTTVLATTLTLASPTPPPEKVEISDLMIRTTSSERGATLNYVEFHLKGNQARDTKCLSGYYDKVPSISVRGSCAADQYFFVFWPSFEGNDHRLEVFDRLSDGSIISGLSRPSTACAEDGRTGFVCMQGAPVKLSLRKGK